MEQIIYERHIVFDTPKELIKELIKMLKEDLKDIFKTGRTDKFKTNKDTLKYL